MNYTTEQLKAISDKRLRRYTERKAAGICVNCKSPSLAGRIYCDRHRLVSNASCRRYHAANAEELRPKKNAAAKEYAKTHKAEIAAYKRSIRVRENELKRTDAYKAKRNARRLVRKASDPIYAVTDLLRKRIGRALRDRHLPRKNKSTVELVGCTIPNLMQHLETLFLPGMSWENRSRWHIDHKTPCAAFNLADPEQQKACFHYTNLQPLWAQDNIRKHAKIQNIGESLCVS